MIKKMCEPKLLAYLGLLVSTLVIIALYSLGRFFVRQQRILEICIAPVAIFWLVSLLLVCSLRKKRKRITPIITIKQIPCVIVVRRSEE